MAPEKEEYQALEKGLKRDLVPSENVAQNVASFVCMMQLPEQQYQFKCCLLYFEYIF